MDKKTTHCICSDQVTDFSRAEVFHIPSTDISTSPTRLEAGFYASEGYRAKEAMKNSGYKLVSVGCLGSVIWFGPFSRCYVDNSEYGIPFLLLRHR